jgi:hypothetical protein
MRHIGRRRADRRHVGRGAERRVSWTVIRRSCSLSPRAVSVAAKRPASTRSPPGADADMAGDPNKWGHASRLGSLSAPTRPSDRPQYRRISPQLTLQRDQRGNPHSHCYVAWICSGGENLTARVCTFICVAIVCKKYASCRGSCFLRSPARIS